MILALLGIGLGLLGGTLIGASVYLNVSGEAATGQAVVQRRSLPTLTPTPNTSRSTPPAPTATSPGATPTNSPDKTGPPSPEPAATGEIEPAKPTPAGTPVVPPTLTVTPLSTPTQVTATPAVDVSIEATAPVEQEVQYVDPYTSTNQVQPPPAAGSTPGVALAATCPVTSTASFDLIPIEGEPVADHPDFRHGDLNLALRGYTPISASLKLEFYNGNTDPNAPQLAGLFEPNRRPKISSVYAVNEWIWDPGQCNGNPRGCRGEPIEAFWPVTLLGLSTTPGEPIYVPERGPQIYSGGFVAMVLYAEERRLTLGYTRQDNVAAGYTIHIENVCVDPNLLALYQAQKDEAGWHTSGFLPALRNNQPLGVALGREVRVAVRDVGSFMDPRSEKDWWR